MKPVLTLNRSQYLELEKIAWGAFKPLKGFMNEDEFHSVVDRLRLTSGEVFPLPVYLDVSEAEAERLQNEKVVLLEVEGETVGELHPESFYRVKKRPAAKKIFGTDDEAHPGVHRFIHSGDVFIGGSVRLTKRYRFADLPEERTLEETHQLFSKNGWKTIVGFQTRNVPHRAHEYLQRAALEQVDGLFIQPLVGWKKRGDYTPEVVEKGYRALIEKFYRPNRVELGFLSTSMRYAGPREALFHAIIRRNYGCTHFIVGRDHAGVGGYYGKYEAHDLIRKFEGDLGIYIMKLHGPYFCTTCDAIVTEHTCPHAILNPEAVKEISGTEMRSILTGGLKPDPRLMRPEVIAALAGSPLFVE